MNDSQMYLATVKSLKDYFHATLREDWATAYEATIDLVDLAQKLEEFACEKNKTIKEKLNVNKTNISGDTDSFNGGDTKAE